MISQKYADKIDRCIEGDVPFALIFMPGETEPLWYSPGDTDSCAGRFGVRTFGIDHTSDPLWVDAETHCTRQDIHCAPCPIAGGTQYDDYIGQVQGIVSRLRQTAGKTVLSRVIALDSPKPFVKVVDEYFERFLYTTRFVYSMPQMGLWFGASPELLVDYQYDTHILKTMSLAGTRPIGAKAPWDSKNIAEHQFVTDFITATLRGLGMDVEITDSSPLRFGCIEHLCDRITARGETDPIKAVDALSPTPALCGTPRDEAYRQIVDTEQHSRHCYGGWLGVMSADRFTAYVNLRSALAAPLPDGGYRYNIYVGGGITADSDPQEEWQETQDKASALLRILNANEL